MKIDDVVKRVAGAAATAIAVIVMVVLLMSTYVVKTGKNAIILRMGNAISAEGPGLHFKIPLVDKVYMMQVANETYYFQRNNEQYPNQHFEVTTKDMQTIIIEAAVETSIINPLETYKLYQGNHSSGIIKPRLRSIMQSVVSEYTIEEFVSKWAAIGSEVESQLKDQLEDKGISVNRVSIINYDFSDEYEKKIEEKKQQMQITETEKSKQEQQNIIKNAEAERIKIQANAELEAEKINLEKKKLEAQGNIEVAKSITPNLLMQKLIEKWNGELPKIFGMDKGMILPQDILGLPNSSNTVPVQ